MKLELFRERCRMVETVQGDLMNQIVIPKKEEHLPDRPIPSLRKFLGLLVPHEEILEYREYIGGQRDCFDYHIWLGTVKRGCFLLDSEKTGIHAAGFLQFERSEQLWIKSENLKFELWSLHSKHNNLDVVKGSNSACGWSMAHGWKMLDLKWSVVTHSGQQTSPEHLNFRASGLTSKSTLYCLNVIERAKTAMGKIEE